MYTRSFIFAAACSALGFICAEGSVLAASPNLSHTQTHTRIELEPIPFSTFPAGSFQVAASTFLPDWIDRLSVYSSPSGMDFSEVSEQNKIFSNCVLKGYNRTSCDVGKFAADFCADSPLYFKNCISSAQVCLRDGYVATCATGYVLDTASICPENPAYGKCIAAPCEGFDYSLSEATAPGYVVGEKCLSGEVEKYARTEAECAGFSYDVSNCGVGSECRKLEGATCLSGVVLKYAECNPCPVPACTGLEVNIETYYCGGALRCLVP